MPDIMIRGVDMPHSCFDCCLNHGEKRPEHGLSIVCKYSYGVVLPEVMGIIGRLPTCGLLELKPHGDLVDTNELRKWSYEVKTNRGKYQRVINVVNIPDLPIIVPASKEENTT